MFAKVVVTKSKRVTLPKLYKFTFAEEILVSAHKHCIFNYNEIQLSKNCGCFYCLKIYQPNKVDNWLKENNVDDPSQYTALCYCGVDAVIGSQSGYPITKSFLSDMHNRWFSI